MAVIPISQPLAPGLLAADYSPWSPESQARSGLFGKYGFLDYTHPTGLTGSTPDITPPTWSAPGGPMVSDVEPVEGVGSGLPMPDVEGYKYVYPRWTYGDGAWERSGYREDRDDYDYYPYFPTGIAEHEGPILVGVELRRE
jgi:hypothetical protein